MITVFCWGGCLYGVDMEKVRESGGLISLPNGELVECCEGWAENYPTYPYAMRGARANRIEAAIAVKAREVNEQRLFDREKLADEALKDWR